jgi:hypothetical protein
MLPLSKSQFLEREIAIKTGKLWDKSVQRLRDKSLQLAFPPAFHKQMGLYQYQRPDGKAVCNPEIGTVIDDFLDKFSNRYLRHLKTDDVRAMHFDTGFVTKAFYDYVLIPYQNNDICDEIATKRLKKFRDKYLPNVYSDSKKLLEDIESHFEQLRSVTSLKTRSSQNANLGDEVQELLDFLDCLCSPRQIIFDPRTEQNLARNIDSLFDNEGKLALNKDDFTRAINQELPRSFNLWLKDMSAKLDNWYSEAQKAYNSVIEYINFDAEQN